jgi:glycosyltransferase involved in cell wall biosynthesis
MKLSGVRLVYTAHNVLPHETSKTDRFMYALIYKSAHHIIVHSDYIKEKLVSKFNIRPEKVHVVPHGNFDIYLPSERITKTEARGKFGLGEEDKVLLFFGYIREYKGLDLLLDAFEKSKECDPTLKLMIAGMPYNENLAKTYNKRIQDISAGDRIIPAFRFIPSEEVKYFFEAADIIILPYKDIDHSGIIHLAYSFCKPVIATNVGDFPETVENGKSGFVINYDKDELSETIVKAFEDIYKLRLMGEHAKYLNDSKYSWTEIGMRTAEIYRSF